MRNDIDIAAETPDLLPQAKKLAEQLQLPVVNIADNESGVCLVVITERLELRDLAAGAPGPIYVDFLAGQLAHRRQYGGGKGQLLAKAVGLKKLQRPRVIDATAGLARDAFVLATLGCDVLMIERSPIVATLVDDAMQRAQHDIDFAALQLNLKVADATHYLSELTEENYPDVVYIDPMFPERTKSALVKKEMRILKRVVGDDIDADALFAQALKVAKKRVVVKRPKGAPALANHKPGLVYRGKSVRYDVYLGI